MPDVAEGFSYTVTGSRAADYHEMRDYLAFSETDQLTGKFSSLNVSKRLEIQTTPLPADKRRSSQAQHTCTFQNGKRLTNDEQGQL